MIYTKIHDRYKIIRILVPYLLHFFFQQMLFIHFQAPGHSFQFCACIHRARQCFCQRLFTIMITALGHNAKPPSISINYPWGCAAGSGSVSKQVQMMEREGRQNLCQLARNDQRVAGGISDRVKDDSAGSSSISCKKRQKMKRQTNCKRTQSDQEKNAGRQPKCPIRPYKFNQHYNGYHFLKSEVREQTNKS